MKITSCKMVLLSKSIKEVMVQRFRYKVANVEAVGLDLQYLEVGPRLHGFLQTLEEGQEFAIVKDTIKTIEMRPIEVEKYEYSLKV